MTCITQVYHRTGTVLTLKKNVNRDYTGKATVCGKGDWGALHHFHTLLITEMKVSKWAEDN
jgi:hypothetical protein